MSDIIQTTSDIILSTCKHLKNKPFSYPEKRQQMRTQLRMMIAVLHCKYNKERAFSSVKLSSPQKLTMKYRKNYKWIATKIQNKIALKLKIKHGENYK